MKFFRLLLSKQTPADRARRQIEDDTRTLYTEQIQLENAKAHIDLLTKRVARLRRQYNIKEA